jgi:hypothetical protein
LRTGNAGKLSRVHRVEGNPRGKNNLGCHRVGARNCLRLYIRPETVRKGNMKRPSKTVISATVWLMGLLLCVLFVGLLLPFGGPAGHQWILPIGGFGMLFFSGGCVIILVVTYFVDRHLTKK